jgi:hypothetical protein
MTFAPAPASFRQQLKANRRESLRGSLRGEKRQFLNQTSFTAREAALFQKKIKETGADRMIRATLPDD